VEIAKALKSHFESVYCSPIDENFDLDQLLSTKGLRALEDIAFTEDDIDKAINDISLKSSAGYSGGAKKSVTYQPRCL